ncbi:MAG: hypothetical protein IKU62_00730 [Ruminiclostridium sp.]|nr:hypothetical protein [Ruminiclostridium sp.]
MKRYILFVLTALLLLALCACSQTPDQTEPEEEYLSVQEPEPPVEEPEEKPEEEELPRVFDPVVPASEAVSADWFADAAFIGDSVSVMLEYYNDAYGTLGKATFLCSESLSPGGALSYAAGHERLPEFPKGSGQRPRLEDAVAASGASKVYVMLGMNCIAGGVDRACQDLVTLIDTILAKSPEATILVQPVTPMTATSPRADAALNNDTIAQYNAKVLEVCRERAWYYVASRDALSNEAGYLRDDYSGDKAMGIHLNYNGAAAWAEYLLTHIPEALK